jgi:transposase
MVRLSHAGWTIPQIAGHFQRTESRVRHWIKAFLSEGFDALDSKKAPGPPVKLTAEILAHLKQTLGQDGRTWTAPQVQAWQEWLEHHYQLSVNRNWLSEVLVKNGLSYKRTTRTVRHKQKPEQVADRKADLETLKRGRTPD